MTDCNVSWRQFIEQVRAIVRATFSASGTDVSESSSVLFNSLILQSSISLIFPGPMPCWPLIAKRGVNGKSRNVSPVIGPGVVIQLLGSSSIDLAQHCIASLKSFGSAKRCTIRFLRVSGLQANSQWIVIAMCISVLKCQFLPPSQQLVTHGKYPW